MQDFVHEKLDVRKAALAVLATADEILDVYRARQSVGDTAIAAGRELLLGIVAMLKRMVMNSIRKEEK